MVLLQCKSPIFSPHPAISLFSKPPRKNSLFLSQPRKGEKAKHTLYLFPALPPKRVSQPTQRQKGDHKPNTLNFKQKQHV